MVEVCATSHFSGNEGVCLTDSGKVLMLSSDDNTNGDSRGKCRPIDSFVGIVITFVVSAPNNPLICMLTNRGILITKGT